MNCREFNEKHVAFVDDTLSGVELVEMQSHIAECERCARLNANVRRALVVAWNLPRIEPSPDFGERLQARLRASILQSSGPRRMRRRVGVAVSLAAAAMLGYIAVTLYKVDSTRDLVLAPVVATVPESDMTLITAPPPAIVTSAPAGLSMWPAALLADEAQVHFVRASLEVPTASR